MSDSNKSRSGFTLIELMLAMTFLSILMIAIAIATIEVSHLYTKGLTIKSVNQAGRDLSDNLRRDAKSIGSGTTNIFVAPSPVSSGLGRLCFGSKSYIWNEASALRAGTGVKYTTVPAGTGNQIVMARVNDAGGSYCVPDTSGDYRSDVAAAESTETMYSKTNELAIYGVSFTPLLLGSPVGQLYNIQFTIGTNDSDTVDTIDTSCQPPSDANSNFNFCSINSFELLIRVG